MTVSSSSTLMVRLRFLFVVHSYPTKSPHWEYTIRTVYLVSPKPDDLFLVSLLHTTTRTGNVPSYDRPMDKLQDHATQLSTSTRAMVQINAIKWTESLEVRISWIIGGGQSKEAWAALLHKTYNIHWTKKSKSSKLVLRHFPSIIGIQSIVE